jgi:hypothetical protein
MFIRLYNIHVCQRVYNPVVIVNETFKIVMYVAFLVFCILFVCKFVQYYCHRVSTQLQLNNIVYL